MKHFSSSFQVVTFIRVFEVFSVTYQYCDNHQGRFVIIFREDSQIDSADENVLLKVSLGPLLLPACMFHSITDNRFKMCYQLSEMTHKIKA